MIIAFIGNNGAGKGKDDVIMKKAWLSASMHFMLNDCLNLRRYD